MDVWEYALGFMDAQLMMTAEELGVFNCLADGCHSVKEVSTATGLPEDSAERMLTALSAMALVKKEADGTYVNSPEANRQLVKGQPGYIGGIFHHLKNDVYPLWQYSKEALLEGKAQWERISAGKLKANSKIYEDPTALRKFMEGMHTITLEAAEEFAEYASAELKEIATLTDVGGASGAFLIALAKRYPHLQGSVYDLPQVRPIAEDYFRQGGLENRLSFQAGDFWEEPIPAGADAYSLGFILHDWSTEQGSILLGKIAKASRPGGWLIIGEFLLNEDKTGPLWVARSSLNMLVTAQGRERNALEYTNWLKEFDFELQQIYVTSKGKNFMVFRYRGES